MILEIYEHCQQQIMLLLRAQSIEAQFSVYGKKGENSDTINEQLQTVESDLPYDSTTLRLANIPIFNIPSTLTLILKQYSLKKGRPRPRPHLFLTRFAGVQKFKQWSFTIRGRTAAYCAPCEKQNGYFQSGSQEPCRYTHICRYVQLKSGTFFF